MMPSCFLLSLSNRTAQVEIALRNVAADRIGELSVGQTKIVRSVKSSEMCPMKCRDVLGQVV